MQRSETPSRERSSAPDSPSSRWARGAKAVAAIVREAPESVVLSWAIGADFVRDARAADASGKAFILALVDPGSASQGISPVLAAGVHDVLLRPFVDSELIARLRAAAHGGRRSPARRASSSPAARSRFDVRRTAAWKNLGVYVAADLGEMVGEQGEGDAGVAGRPRSAAAIRDQPHVPGHPGDRASSVRGRGSRHTSLAGPRAPERIGRHRCGHERRSSRAREHGRRGAQAHGPEGAHRDDDEASLSNVAWVAPSGENVVAFGRQSAQEKAALVVLGEVRQRANREVKASELEEDMVLVHDVRSPSGVLLVTAGSRLTRTTAERLRALLGGKSVLEVAYVRRP